MSAPDVRDVLFNAGRLASGVSDLTIPYPHGGIGLGFVRAITVLPNIRHGAVTAEEYGGEEVERIYQGESWVLTAILRSFDNDAIEKIFQNTSVGATSQHRLITHPGANRAGRLLASTGVVLAFSPLSPDAPMLVMHRAIPLVDSTAEFNLSIDTPQETGLIFVGVRNAAGKMVSMGRREDITL